MSVAAPPRKGAYGDAGPVPHASRLLRRLAGDRAEERVFRALAFGFLPGAVVFGLLAMPTAIAQAPHFPRWWDVAAFTLGVAPSAALGGVAFIAPLGVLRRIALVALVSAIVVQASIPLVVLPWPHADEQAWFLQVSGLGLIAPALALRPRAAIVAQVLGAVVIALTRGATDHTDAALQGLQDGLYVLLFVVTFLALGLSALGAGRLADQDEAHAAAAAVAAAADAARERERARINALVHDRVLATLLSAARPVQGSSDLERSDALRALDGLRALLEDRTPDAMDGLGLVYQVQAVTTDLVPEAGFGHDVDGEVEVPGEIAEALLQAVEEALRNSLRHGGPANRTVHVRVGISGVAIDVLDDGIGFDRTTVPVTRLGIAESIEGRMRALPGGAADVVTQPGVGTRVVLRWRRPWG